MAQSSPQEPGSAPKTCFAFSLHKSGSTLLTNMLKDICEAENLPHRDIPGEMFHENVPNKQWAADKSLLDRIIPGGLNIGFRFFPEFLGEFDFTQARSILLVRDPRDALVSRYFSFRPGGSHAAPLKNRKQWLENRDSAEDPGIEAFVKKSSFSVRRKMRSYLPLIAAQNVRIFRYEEVYFDKFAFLKEVFEHFEMDLPEERLRAVADKHDVRPDAEDPSKHIRKGAPGDYKEKLQPETIAWLNDYFGPTGKSLGYDLT